jgi:hypothetical protein
MDFFIKISKNKKPDFKNGPVLLPETKIIFKILSVGSEEFNTWRIAIMNGLTLYLGSS